MKAITALFMAGLLTVYGVCATLTYGAMLSHRAHTFPTFKGFRDWREDLSMAVLFAVVPIAGWAAGFFVTGFYADGFIFTYGQWLAAKEGRRK